MRRHTASLIALLALLAFLPGCVTTQPGGAARGEVSAADYNRKPNDGVVDLDSQTVIAATILQMMSRDTSQAPVMWDKHGSFKAAFDGFTYEGFGVTGVDVFDQQQTPDGMITVQALVRLQHVVSGARAANVVMAVYSDGGAAKAAAAPAKTKKGKTAKNAAPAASAASMPVIHRTMAGPIPSRDPELEVRVVPSEMVAAEKAFKAPSYPDWLMAARRLAVAAPTSGKAKVHIFVFAKDRVFAGADLKIESADKKSGQATCLDDSGFAACVVSGEITGTGNRALFYLNGQKAAEAPVR